MGGRLGSTASVLQHAGEGRVAHQWQHRGERRLGVHWQMERMLTMRDRHFIAVHRGGPLSMEHHRLLAAWAADCAQRVRKFCGDPRVDAAIETARAWARGEVKTGVAQKAAVAAHAAAREAANPAACAAARAAGHAAATAHMAEHSLGAVLYAIKALRAAGKPLEKEKAWQVNRLPVEVREIVADALAGPRFKSWAIDSRSSE